MNFSCLNFYPRDSHYNLGRQVCSSHFDLPKIWQPPQNRTLPNFKLGKVLFSGVARFLCHFLGGLCKLFNVFRGDPVWAILGVIQFLYLNSNMSLIINLPNPEEFWRQWIFGCLIFCGGWILSNSIFWDIWHLILDEHPCQMNACMPPPGKRELRPTEYQLSQVIKGQIALYRISDNDMKFLFHATAAHMSKINEVPLPTCNSLILHKIHCKEFNVVLSYH